MQCNVLVVCTKRAKITDACQRFSFHIHTGNFYRCCMMTKTGVHIMIYHMRLSIPNTCMSIARMCPISLFASVDNVVTRLRGSASDTVFIVSVTHQAYNLSAFRIFTF